MPTPTQVHLNTPLTNLSLAFLQNQSAFVADRIFPTVPVDKASDLYYTYDRADFNRDEAQLRAPSAESAGGGYTLSSDSYNCRVWAYHKDVADQVRSNADAALDPDREATEFVTHKMLIRKERNFVTNYMTTGIWGYQRVGDVSGSITPSTEVVYWSDYTNSDPILNVKNAATAIQASTGYRPNKLVLSRDVYDILTEHPDFIDRVKYGQTPGSPAIAGRIAMAQLFDVDEVVVMEAIFNSAREGATAVHDFVGSKSALLVYAAPTPGLMTPSAGYTFSWRAYSAGKDIAVSKFRLDVLRSDRIEAEIAFDQKLVSSALGAFFGTIIV